MAQVIASFAPLARVGLKDVIDLESKKRTNQWSVIADKISTKQQFERFDQIGDFSYATIAAEMGGVTYDTLDRGFTADFYPLMRAIGFRISIQASYTDLYNKIKNPGPKLARAMDATMELEVANLLNNGFSSSYLGIDGVALFSTAHPLATTTTGNKPASSEYTLSSTSLEIALQERRRQKTHRGKPYPQTGNVKLVVPPELEMVADRIVSSVKLAQTADNDPNVAGRRTTVYVNDYLTSTTAWFLLPKEDNPLFLLTRIPRDVVTKFDEDTLSYKFVTYEEYIRGWFDWRGTWATSGA